MKSVWRMRINGWLVRLLIAGTFLGHTSSGITQHLEPSLRINRLVVHKADRRMDAFNGDVLVRSYRIAIGGGGEGPKLYEGDRRTPEGRYRVVRRRVSQAFHRFLLLSYPNRTDIQRYRRARAEGLVPESAGIGRAIGIHGATGGLSLLAPNIRYSWTDGCIAVTNEEIEELYGSVVDDAAVEILP